MTQDVLFETTIAAAQREREERGARAAFLPSTICHDNAWDMMLFVYVSQARPVSIGEVCKASRAARTTALRYLTLLENEGLLRRHLNASDRRSEFIYLTAEGYAAIRAYYEHVCRQRLADGA